MQLGIALPQVGAAADPSLITTTVRRAEQLGYSSGWVNDRVLWPTDPRAPYPASADGSLPTAWHRNFDALDVLTFAAAQTTTLRLGTSVLILPLYNPVLLARRLTTIDILSNGRLTAGFGLGWSPDEYATANVSMVGQARRLDDSLDLIDKLWAGGIVQHDSEFVSLAPSVFEARPVQRPRPPIYLAAYTPAGLGRIARRADGWIPAGVPIAAVGAMRQAIDQMAVDAGRDPSSIGCIVRANVHIAEGFADEPDRPPFYGTVEQISADVRHCEDIGIDEVFVDVQFSPGGDDPAQYLEHIERFAELIPVPVPV